MAKNCKSYHLSFFYQVEEVCNTEKMKTLELFNKIWGAGPTVAEAWYQQGFR
jgi:hypothetical protein